MKATMDSASIAQRALKRQRARARAIEQGRHSKTNRREAAAKRQTARDARSAKAQLKVLDRRLGKGQGAVRERARLAAA